MQKINKETRQWETSSGASLVNLDLHGFVNNAFLVAFLKMLSKNCKPKYSYGGIWQKQYKICELRVKFWQCSKHGTRIGNVVYVGLVIYVKC